MSIVISFPGGKRVDAHFGDVSVPTDQPIEAGGERSAAAPFELFLASLGTCAGYYVLAFCQARGLPTEGLSIVQRTVADPETHLPARVDIEVRLPPGFPDKYRAAVQRAAEHCKVKKALEAPPVVAVRLVEPAAAALSAS